MAVFAEEEIDSLKDFASGIWYDTEYYDIMVH